jgi:hypothetical protein
LLFEHCRPQPSKERDPVLLNPATAILGAAVSSINPYGISRKSPAKPLDLAL